MKPRLTALALALPLLVLTACEPASPPASRFKSVDVSQVDWGRDFSLTDHEGRPRTLSDFRGKVVMMFFGFTNCPDVCPATMAEMAQVVQRLGEDGRRVQGLMVSVDPARDTPEALKRYVTAFHPDFLGLRGDAQATAALAREFKAHFEARETPHAHHGHYMVDHTRAVYVFDTGGRLRLLMTTGRTVEDMTADIALLLKA